jgi:hypothetical protein
MNRINHIIEVSPYMEMVVADLEHKRQLLSIHEKEKMFPFYERVFRTTMEVYKANNIIVDSFELYEKPGHWELKINGEMAIIEKGGPNA